MPQKTLPQSDVFHMVIGTLSISWIVCRRDARALTNIYVYVHMRVSVCATMCKCVRATLCLYLLIHKLNK